MPENLCILFCYCVIILYICNTKKEVIKAFDVLWKLKQKAPAGKAGAGGADRPILIDPLNKSPDKWVFELFGESGK